MLRSIEGGIINGDGFSWNAGGNVCGVINKNGSVTVYDVSKNFEALFEASCCLKGIKSFYFSPLSTYLVTAERMESKTAPNTPNMALWHVAGKSKIVEGKLRQLASNAWPSMKWTVDETCCCRVLSVEDSPVPRSDPSSGRTPYLMQVLNSKTSKTDNIEIPGVSAVEICPFKSGSTLVSVFVASTDTSPVAKLQIFDLADTSKPAVLSHEFEKKVDICSMKWSSTGKRLLVQAGSEIDESGQSYYGTSHLYLVNLDLLSTVGVAHEGHVQDFQWSPSGDLFCLISGLTPFTTQLFDSDGHIVHDFGTSRKNTVKFSNSGRFLALGGFGNLAGELDFIDVPSTALLNCTRAECTVECGWAPNGRVFMTSSTHPRMRVDNNITLFKYSGEKIARLDFPELYSAKWRPMPRTQFPDPPASPVTKVNKAPTIDVPKKAYRPPTSAEAGSGLVTQRTCSPPPPPPPPKGPITIPCPEKDWFYRDPKGEVHGPYSKTVMHNWSKAGYFKPELPMRAGTVLPFVKMTDLFPGPAFETSMVVPPEWLNYKQQ